MLIKPDNNLIEIKNKPLVSIVVVTYNSGKFILETLESIYKQTYDNIELIISDDCSKDNTVGICENWLDKNNRRFIRTKLITTDENTGIPGNANRGLKEAHGEWIRYIGGDDVFFERAIEYSVRYITLNNQVLIFTSKKAIYKNNFEVQNCIIEEEKPDPTFYNLSPELQYRRLLHENVVNTVGIILRREFLCEMNGFDERLKFIEDYPFYLKITKLGFKIYFMDQLTVKYRKHDSSVRTIDSHKNAIFNKFYLKKRIFMKLYIYPNISKFGRFALDYEFYRHLIIDLLKLNRKNFIGRSIYFISGKTSPIRIKKLFY